MLHPIESLAQSVGVLGLLQVRFSSESEAAPVILIHRDDVYRNVAGRRIVLQPAQNQPAGHIGQPDIQRNRGGPQFASQVQPFIAARGDDAFKATLATQLDQKRDESHIVLDEEEDLVAGCN